MKASDRRAAVLWTLLALVLALAPLVFMFVGRRPTGRAFDRTLSVGLGFVGIGLMAVHFMLTARIANLMLPFGADVVYRIHHYVGYGTLFFWLAHPIILFIRYDWAIRILNVFTTNWRGRYGVFSVVAMLLLIGLVVVRRRARMEYVLWRMSHGALAVLAMLLVMVHAYMVGGYTGTPLKQALWMGYGGVCVLLVGYLRIYKPWRMLRRPYRVVGVKAEHGAVYSLALEPVGRSGITFLPGQFAWLTAGNSPFSAHEHPFSFSSSSETPQRVEFAVKELGDFSRTIKDLPLGERVYIDGPYGSCSPDCHFGAEELLLIAGGIGIAPMMSILRTMADRHDSRPVQLIYGSYSLDWASFREELDALAKTLNLRVVHALEHPPQGWTGETGYVTAEMLRRYLPSGENRYRVFVCGPLSMLSAVTRALVSLGVPRALISLERFDLA